MSADVRRPPAIAQQFNKVAAKLAGRPFFPLWALIDHRGRKSGKAYRTPVAIVASSDDAVYIALPWGRTTDWIRNLQALDGGSLRWKGREHAISAPEFVDQDEVVAASGRVLAAVTRRAGFDEFLKLTLR